MYEKTFSRDFTLAIIEIWYRSEAVIPKKWTTEKQPFMPFIFAERSGGRFLCYYDPRGIAWLKELLFKKAREDKDFVASIVRNIEQQMDYFQPIYESQKALPEKELILFLKKLVVYWSWFEAAWWLWESAPEERPGVELSEHFMKLRELTQEIAPGSDVVVKKSLEKLYPELKDLILVIRLEELFSGNIPDREVLEKRYRGFFFINDKLYVGATKEDIEKEFGIELERVVADKQTKELRGKSVIKKETVRGTVKLLMNSKENDKVQEGDIIVSPMTMPDFLPAMKKAAAFVTDEGGIMCHAAIVSRELSKPCIVGTKIATQVLKDGDEIEVDAEKGIVRKI